VSLLDDPKHWRGRATQLRAMVRDLIDLQARAELLQLARGYDRIAERAEATAAAKTVFASFDGRPQMKRVSDDM
jgi:hypothetical protein